MKFLTFISSTSFTFKLKTHQVFKPGSFKRTSQALTDTKIGYFSMRKHFRVKNIIIFIISLTELFYMHDKMYQLLNNTLCLFHILQVFNSHNIPSYANKV